jgi:TRAP transporter TAXI family solute receptor
MKRALLVSVVFLIGNAQAQTLGIGTAPQGTIGYNIGSAVAKVLAETENLQSRVQPYSGSSAVFPLVNTGEMDLTVGNTLEAQEAANGEGPYAGRKQANLRVLAVIFPLNVGLFVKKDSPIKTIADLKGRRVTYGYTAQVTLKRVVDAILANGGIDASYVRTALVPNVVRGADDFIEGKADAAFFAIGAGKVAEADKSVGGIRFLALSDDPKAVAAMKEIYPYAYVNEVRPRPNLAGIGVPTKLMAYDYLIVSGAHVKDDVVYRITRALNAHKDKLVASLAAFGDFNPATMHKPVPAPFHPGSLKYYAEKGMVRK